MILWWITFLQRRVQHVLFFTIFIKILLRFLNFFLWNSKALKNRVSSVMRYVVWHHFWIVAIRIFIQFTSRAVVKIIWIVSLTVIMQIVIYLTYYSWVGWASQTSVVNSPFMMRFIRGKLKDVLSFCLILCSMLINVVVNLITQQFVLSFKVFVKTLQSCYVVFLFSTYIFIMRNIVKISSTLFSSLSYRVF